MGVSAVLEIPAIVRRSSPSQFRIVQLQPRDSLSGGFVGFTIEIGVGPYRAISQIDVERVRPEPDWIQNVLVLTLPTVCRQTGEPEVGPVVGTPRCLGLRDEVIRRQVAGYGIDANGKVRTNLRIGGSKLSKCPPPVWRQRLPRRQRRRGGDGPCSQPLHAGLADLVVEVFRFRLQVDGNHSIHPLRRQMCCHRIRNSSAKGSRDATRLRFISCTVSRLGSSSSRRRAACSTSSS